MPENEQSKTVSVIRDNTNSTDTYANNGVVLTLSSQGSSMNPLSSTAKIYTAAAASSVLKVGSRGAAVTQLQKNLTTLGYDTKGTDGIFGNDTKNAVLSFQRAHGLTADGIVGSGTQSAIATALNYHNKGILVVGSRGTAVTELQKNLTKLGYDTKGTDGIFGNDTKNAVIAFQRAKGLTPDGMVGSDTQNAIKKALSNNSSTPVTPTTGAKYQSIQNGKVMKLPKPGDVIEVSMGIDKSSQKAKVSKTNAWSIEYSIAGCRKNYPNALCTKRLNYALSNFSYNAGKEELLQLSINNKQCYAGAMIEGFGNIGDVAEITLDDGTKFNFLILDTKSKNHSSSELQANSNSSTPQCQNQYGHGYMLNGGESVQLSVCEFIVSESNGKGSAVNYSNGEFLKSRYVTQAKIIGHVEIDKNL